MRTLYNIRRCRSAAGFCALHPYEFISMIRRMKRLVLFVCFFSLICGCKQKEQEIIVGSDKEDEHWETVTRTTKSLDDLFEASYHLRWYFPEEFRRLGEEKSYRYLISKLRSPDPKVRDNAASCLRNFPYADRNAQLVDAYKRETVLDVRLGILFAMCNTNGSPEVASLLTDILEGNDNTVRWSAARSLSVINFPNTDDLLLKYKDDPDPKVREEVAFHFDEKKQELIITGSEAKQLLELAARLINADGSNRTIDLALLPQEIGKKQMLGGRIYERVLLVQLFYPDGGVVINPTRQNTSPALNRYWISGTQHTGILRYDTIK
jgi:hypothetical protein